jgi:hypothetical protein
METTELAVVNAQNAVQIFTQQVRERIDRLREFADRRASQLRHELEGK